MKITVKISKSGLHLAKRLTAQHPSRYPSLDVLITEAIVHLNLLELIKAIDPASSLTRPPTILIAESPLTSYPNGSWTPGMGPGERTDLLLLKHVLAASGDFVSTLDDELRVNGVLIGPIASVDFDGRPLPRWPATRVLSGDELLVGSSQPRSFDARRDNILIAGGTGSGKTTLANAVLAEPQFAQDRVLLIEDTRELQCGSPDRVELLTKPRTIQLIVFVRRTHRGRRIKAISRVKGFEGSDYQIERSEGH